MLLFYGLVDVFLFVKTKFSLIRACIFLSTSPRWNSILTFGVLNCLSYLSLIRMSEIKVKWLSLQIKTISDVFLLAFIVFTASSTQLAHCFYLTSLGTLAIVQIFYELV